MDEQKKADEKYKQALDDLITKGVNDETYKALDDAGTEYLVKFDAERMEMKVNCFCGNLIEDPTEQEVAPSMFYTNRRTCSVVCHNLWVLGAFEGTSKPTGKGWDKILKDLNEDIYALDPDYRIDQVKEKFGTLRYYASFKEPELPLGITREEVWAVGSIVNDLGWAIRGQKDDDGPDGEARWPDWKLEKAERDYAAAKALQDKLQPIRALILAAEALTESTCEWCGEQGEARPGGWVLTLCDGCNEKKEAGRRPWDEKDGEGE